MAHTLRLRRAFAPCLIILALSACGASQQASTAAQSPTTATSSTASGSPIAASTNNSVESAAPTPATTTSQLIYYWPQELPQGMMIDLTRSTADETGFTLALIDPADAQRTLDFYGGPGTPAMARPPAIGSLPIEINGQQGTRFSTGAGTSLHWDEHGQPFRISGFFDRNEMILLVNQAEALDLAQWRSRLNSTVQ